MQTGRHYRAALPRFNLADAGWNSRAPKWIRIDGSTGWDHMSLLYPGGPSDSAAYHPADVSYTWRGRFTQGGHAFEWTFVQRQNIGRQGAEFSLLVTDDIGGSSLTTFDWQPGDLSWGAADFLQDPVPMTEVVTGEFLPHGFFGSFFPIAYHDEP